MNIETLKAHLSEPRGKPFLVLDDMKSPTKIVNNHTIMAKSRATDAGEPELSVAKKIVAEADWFAFHSVKVIPAVCDEAGNIVEARTVLRFASGTFSEIGL